MHGKKLEHIGNNKNMDLIIKPTQACNFRCDFCSSNNITSNKNILSLDAIYKILKKYDINTIIVNGGDPLMMPPSYYNSILNFIESQNKNTTISFTTNLWDFYKNPDKWKDIFKHPLVGVTTSFQYGNERKLHDGSVFTENIFCDIINMFKEYIDYTPMFISVTTEKNDKYVIDTVKLAKRIGTTCKINPAVMSGRTRKCYPLWKMYQKYLDIIDAGLEKYEFNSHILKNVINNKHNICPFSRECWKSIRAINPDGIIHSCGCYNDDHYNNIKLNKKTYDLCKYNEKELLNDHKALKNECFACDLFMLCNSCFKNMDDIIESNSINEHCYHMKQLEERIKAL
jgi:MoaA/NifB/PqqE/SkfB family radical SAM enzyme